MTRVLLGSADQSRQYADMFHHDTQSAESSVWHCAGGPTLPTMRAVVGMDWARGDDVPIMVAFVVVFVIVVVPFWAGGRGLFESRIENGAEWGGLGEV